MNDLALLRRTIRRQRRQLTRQQQQAAGLAVMQRVIRHPSLKCWRRIGLYHAAFGEIPTRPLLIQLHRLGKQLYLPVIVGRQSRLYWQSIHPTARLGQHRLGMRQPMVNRAQSIAQLDVVLMPLVMFDAQGQRVGMGGGFYDRTLQHAPVRPWRIGLAYDFQRTQHLLVPQPWDQGLDQVITPNRCYRFKRQSALR